VSKDGRKTAEEMNAERRAAKQRQKHGGKKKQTGAGFTMQDLRHEAQKKRRAEEFKANRVATIMAEADVAVLGKGLAGVPTVQKVSEFYFELRQAIQESGNYILLESKAHDQIWWWPKKRQAAQAA
jgi:hypothetical protein